MTSFLARRPWPIHVFAAIFGGIALYGLIVDLQSLDVWVLELTRIVPEVDWDRDRTIIVFSARFTIVMIPIVAIWGFGSGIARLIVAGMTLLSLPGAAMQIYDRWGMGFETWGRPAVLSFLTIGAVSVLFTASAKSWFGKERAIDPATFE